MEPLDLLEVRILGSLIEKALSTPDYYPLSLNALTNACNQSSNRDPVVSFSEESVAKGLDGLREKKLAFQFQGAESRVSKFGHRAVETFGLERAELAVLCVLLLRGPQTVGEVRGRTGRMHEFTNLEEAQSVLSRLASRPEGPLVAKLPRQAGMKEQRFAHLLGGVVTPVGCEVGSDPEPAVARGRMDEERLAWLEKETATLRDEVAQLRREWAEFKKLLE